MITFPNDQIVDKYYTIYYSTTVHVITDSCLYNSSPVIEIVPPKTKFSANLHIAPTSSNPFSGTQQRTPASTLKMRFHTIKMLISNMGEKLALSIKRSILFWLNRRTPEPTETLFHLYCI